MHIINKIDATDIGLDMVKWMGRTFKSHIYIHVFGSLAEAAPYSLWLAMAALPLDWLLRDKSFIETTTTTTLSHYTQSVGYKQ